MARRNIPSTKRRKIYERDNFTCRYCGMTNMEQGVISIDHIIPICHGGTNEEDNLVTACCYCNKKKHDKSLKDAGLTLINLKHVDYSVKDRQGV